MLPSDVKPLGAYIEEAGYETAYIGKWHLASDGELEQKPTIDHTITAIPQELRGGYTGFWRASDVLEFTSHGYDGYIFDENNKRIDFEGYRCDCLTDMALEFFDQRNEEKPFFMTISHIEPHHQNDRGHFEGPTDTVNLYKDYPLPEDLTFLKGNYKKEYPDYLAAIGSLDKNVGRLVKLLKDKGEAMGLSKVTINDMVLYAVARVLPNFPEINANLVGDSFRKFKHANIGMAVDTDRGLLVPVIFGSDTLSLAEISQKTKALAGSAREGTLSPDDMSGGSFTVSNLGSMGVESFTPVINPPQTAILGVCCTTNRLKADGSVYPAMGLSLTFDHRAVDGAPAAKFLKELCTALENFELLLAK